MQEQRRSHNQITLHSGSAVAATENGEAVMAHQAPRGYTFVLETTDLTSAVDDLFDVYIQTSFRLAAGTDEWLPICRFTRLLGNGTNAQVLVNSVRFDLGMANERTAATGTPWALVAGETVNLLGDRLRVRLVVTNGAGTHTITYRVVAIPM